MVRTWRRLIVVAMLALGVTGIGATAHFGVTMNGAVASAAVASGHVGEDAWCLLHCLAANDMHVSDGMLAMATMIVVAAIAVLAVYGAIDATRTGYRYFAFVRVPPPRSRFVLCKRE